MTALSLPSLTSRLPWLTSPWNQTGVPCHSAASAASHTAVAALPSHANSMNFRWSSTRETACRRRGSLNGAVWLLTYIG